MKAVRIHNYGGPEVLTYEDVPQPTAGEGEVLIRVHASSVNPFDWKTRQGYLVGWINHALPLTLGWDVSGVVEAVGPGVTGFAVGDAVYGRADVTRNGTYAEYAAVRATEVVHKPKSLDHVHAAAVPHVALAAWQSLISTAGLVSGQSVLIHAAAGGVGSIAVQLAKWRGAKVIGTASTRNVDFLRELGADQVIDYSTTRFEDVVRDVDVVLDTMGGETLERSWAVLKPGGMLVSLVQPPSEETAARYRVRACLVGAMSDPNILGEIARLIDSGQIKPIVSSVVPLEDIRKAHALSESLHTRGKIVLQIVN